MTPLSVTRQCLRMMIPEKLVPTKNQTHHSDIGVQREASGIVRVHLLSAGACCSPVDLQQNSTRGIGLGVVGFTM